MASTYGWFGYMNQCDFEQAATFTYSDKKREKKKKKKKKKLNNAIRRHRTPGSRHKHAYSKEKPS